MKIYIIFLFSFWVVFFYLLLTISLPNNVLSPYLSKTSKFKVYTIIPEGWGFFTRNPRELRQTYLIHKDNKWVPDPRIRNGTLINIYGIKREGRLLAFIYGRFQEHISANSWLTIKDYNFQKFDLNSHIIPTITIKYPSKILDLPDDLIIVEREITPWAYRNFENKIGLPVKLIRLHIIKN